MMPLREFATILATAALVACQSPPEGNEPTRSAGTIAEAQRACASDIQNLCSAAGSDRRAIRQCLVEHRTDVSNQCRAALQSLRNARAPATGEPPASSGAALAPTHADLRYATPTQGVDPALLSLDLYLPPARGTPLVVFVHGGGWAQGDKRGGARGQPQAFVSNGYAYATINYRLHPQARPEQQAADIARSIAFLRANASTYGYDSQRIILMGHSAGAHLAALVALDPSYLRAADVDPAIVRAIVLLDGAGYDIPRQIATGGNANLYETIFGADEASQLRLSPLTHVGEGPTPDAILHFVATREASRLQSESLSAAIRASGGTAETFAAADETHASINRGFGEPGDPTTVRTFEFLRGVLR